MKQDTDGVLDLPWWMFFVVLVVIAAPGTICVVLEAYVPAALAIAVSLACFAALLTALLLLDAKRGKRRSTE